MRKLVFLLALLAAGLVVYKKTTLGSYAGTVWTQVQQEARDQVPTRFEIERVRHEVANLETDVSQMIRPIAEYMAAIAGLKKDIAATESSVSEQRVTLLTMTRDLDGSPAFVEYAGTKYTAERVRAKLQRDFDSFKRLEVHLASQKKLLEAKETSLKATQDQLAKVLAKKREYEVRLAQLEADEETLAVARIGSSPTIDSSRATQIEAALASIEHRHNVQRAEVELKTGSFANDAIPVQSPNKTSDVQAIRQYLEAPGTATASKE